MDLGLNNLRALVTGASDGLGYATALCLAREGVNLSINSRDENKLAQAAERISAESNTKVHTIPGDLSVADVPAKVVETAGERLGGLDLLVTNTGGPPPGYFEEFDDKDWDDAIDLVFRSHLRLIRAALPLLRNSDSASVLTVTSTSVKQPNTSLILSSVGRAATVGLTKTLALELGSDGIRFNSIMPASIETQRIHNLVEQRALERGTTIEDEFSVRRKASVLGRLGKPEEFANAAVFLLSPAAGYITGVMLSVDGGINKGIM